ncbi:spermidine dehydrogenase SpdH [Halioglobus japonicus]|uniref:Twin-arginine translocation pathway signal n=1 Tax=Halioglobus japonicus TaxID=930805 RepID=A0AAP8SPA5_9GAMM|nr:twin-arginine translocation pathway signal [Halioglobus japonicus]GHD08879.1 spermidine dehydrogenase SpdH [Halioglobus japonicus]
MVKKTDSQLGMHRPITRRDFVQGVSMLAAGASLGGSTLAFAGQATDSDYPPTLTGMRGSAPGSFELAHALRDGARMGAAKTLEERYDLIVVGAGISGLAAALYYRQRFGDKARILVLDNNDDFGGHARRNEFHQGGPMRLALGGTQNMEHWSYSEVARGMIESLGIDMQALLRERTFAYGDHPQNGDAAWFDEATFGENKLVTNYTLEGWALGDSLDCIDELPLGDEARADLRRLYTERTNVLPDLDDEARYAFLQSISYPEFLQKHCGISPEVTRIFDTTMHSSWGVELRALSAAEAMDTGAPGRNMVGWDFNREAFQYPVAMFPDGNASIARLMVQRLIPEVSPQATAENVAMARFDYAKLDRAETPVRLRLNAMVTNVQNQDDGVAVTYVKRGEALRVQARHCVMATYHSMIPYLVPALSEAQQEALKYQVKIPMLMTNVLIRSSKPLEKLGIEGARCPGRMHGDMYVWRGIDTGGYTQGAAEDEPVVLGFSGTLSPPDDAYDLKAQLRGSRQRMLELEFADYEREVRTVLDGLLGPAGFDVTEDILAITVNRWPHGYAYEYMDLWDDDFAPGQAPHEIARQPFGNITIANTDAGAEAYTHTAIDQAYRAVGELPA